MTNDNTPWRWTCHPSQIAANIASLTTVDVCVVGSGIAGLTTAYALACAGRSVVVLEAHGIGSGETAHTSAHLASALDDRFTALERLHGLTGSRLAAQSHAAAIDFIERLVGERRINCEFSRVDGFLFTTAGDGSGLEDEFAAATRAGLPVEQIAGVPGAESWSGPALRFPRQARFDPMAYLQGLVEAALAVGVRLFPHTRVARITDGPLVEVETIGGHVLKASTVVVATNVPINDRLLLQTKLAAYRTYVLAVRIPPGAFPDALVWDDGHPYHYLRLIPDADGTGPLLLIGGEDHKTGQNPEDPNEPYRHLERWLRERMPAAGEIIHAWSGQIIEPVDSLAYIGRNPGGTNVYVATGDSGNGLTHGTLAGLLITDLVCGIPNAWEELYRPSRITLKAAVEYAGRNTDTLRQYADWLATLGGAPDAEIPRGGGATRWEGLQPVAIHRDEAGHLHTCSAVCPHLGGLVRWNATEKTWDCPCHGSRFSSDGTVLNGPANKDLAPLADSHGDMPSLVVQN